MTGSDYLTFGAAVIFGGVILLAAVKIGWGALLWAKRVDFRVGQRWGDEPVLVKEWSGKSGYVDAGGERWRAVSKQALQPGDHVVVARVKGLTLEVRKA